MKLYNRFTDNDLKTTISKYKHGWTMTEISKYLGVSKNTISYNLKKSKYHIWIKRQYNDKKINKYAYWRWKENKEKTKDDLSYFKQEKLANKYKTFIHFAHNQVNKTISGRKKLFSPEAIIDLFQKSILLKYAWLVFPRKSQFYNWINQRKYGFAKYMFPNDGGRKHKKKHTNIKVSKFISIENRPKEINERLEEGHFEIDSLIGKRSDRLALSTMIDRKTRKIAIHPYIKYNSLSFLKAVKINLSKFKIIKSITMDNGPENYNLDKLDSKISIYHTHPYSSFEKGSIENMHRLIRRIKSKSTSLDNIDFEEINIIENYINNYPRKILRL